MLFSEEGSALGSGSLVSVLLRQPHGFESLSSIIEALDAGDLAFSHGPHLRVPSIYLHPALLASGTVDGGENDLVASIDKIVDLTHVVLKGLEPSAKRTP